MSLRLAALQISDEVKATYGPSGQTPAAQADGLTSALYITAFVCVVGGGAFLFATLFVEMDRSKVDKAKSSIDEDRKALMDEEHRPDDLMEEPIINT